MDTKDPKTKFITRDLCCHGRTLAVGRAGRTELVVEQLPALREVAGLRLGQHSPEVHVKVRALQRRDGLAQLL